MVQASKNHPPSQSKKLITILNWVLIVVGMSLLGVGIYQLFPFIAFGVNHYTDYLTWQWAHESRLVEGFLQLALALWFVFTLMVFSTWLIHRSIRKLTGKPWRTIDKNKHRHFFPKLIPFIKWSCLYLALVWLFVIGQYPVQYMLF